jgi:hypothetical protein
MPMIAEAASKAAEKFGGQALGAFELVKGLRDEKKSKRELARLNRPLYGIQSEYYKNENIAEQMAGQGYTSVAKDYMTSEAGRGLSSTIGALTQTGAGINDISKSLDVYSRNIRQIGAEDAEKQLQNMQYFMNTNKDLAGQKTMQWTINEYQPYQAKLKELQERSAAAQQNIWGGLGTILGATSAANTANSNQGLLDKLFSNTQPQFMNEANIPNVSSPMPQTQSVYSGTAPDTSLSTLGRPLSLTGSFQ